MYNERETILEIIQRVQSVDLGDWERELIVVDNCSTDGTRELLKTVTAPNVRIVYQLKNMGKGNSVRTAIPLCSGDYSITQDADLEYDPQEYPKLIQKAVSENFDVVYGSRVLGGKRYHHYAANYWGVRFLTLLTNLLFGARYTDVATNYKLMRTPILQSLKLTCSGFDLDFELSDKLALATRASAKCRLVLTRAPISKGRRFGCGMGYMPC